MRLLQLRQKKWFLDGYLILNGTEITDLNEAVPDFELADILGSEKDYLVVCDSYEEMVSFMDSMYVSFFRFYDNFKRNATVIWINKDADIPVATRFIGKNCAYLGKWDYPFWQRLKREMLDICERRLIVKREWLEWRRLEVSVKQDDFFMK